MKVKEFLKNLEDEYILFNECLVNVHSEDDGLLQEDIIYCNLKFNMTINDNWWYRDYKDNEKLKEFSDYESYALELIMDSGAYVNILLIHKQEKLASNFITELEQTMSEMFKYNLSWKPDFYYGRERFHFCNCELNFNMITTLYRSLDFASNISLVYDSFWNRVALFDTYGDNINNLDNTRFQFIDRRVNEIYKEKLLSTINARLEERKEKARQESIKINNIAGGKILSIAYTTRLSIKALCFEKDGKKHSIEVNNLETSSMSVLLKCIGEFLTKETTVVFRKEDETEVYAADIRYLFENTTIKKDKDGKKYTTINRKRVYISEETTDILEKAGKAVGIDEDKLSMWLLLASI